MSNVEISPRRARELQSKGYELIDVRSELEFAEVHAINAINVPLETFSAEQLAGDKPGYLIICKSGARARKALEKIRLDEQQRTSIVAGGTDQWIAEGLPVERQHGVVSLERQVRLAVGILVLASAILTVTVNIYFVLLAGFVACGLIFAAVTNTCGMALMLARMPWNKSLVCDLKTEKKA